MFTLAQHIKDKHGGINASEQSSDTVSNAHIVMSDYMFPCLGSSQASSGPHRGRSSAVDKRRGPGISRDLPEKPHEAPSLVQGRNKRDKKMTTLKKAYVKQKATRMTHVWTDIIQLLTDKIAHVEKLREVNKGQMEIYLANEDNTEPMWSDLQTSEARHEVLCDQLNQLLAMKSLCQEKLKRVRISLKKKMHRASEKIQREEFMQHDARDHFIDQIQGEQTGDSRPQACRDDGNLPHELYTTDWQDCASSVDSSIFSDDVSDGSSTSDDSFDLQWGDTLHTWAQSMGHGQKRAVPKGREENCAESSPVVLPQNEDPVRTIIGNSGPTDTKSVRVISTSFAALSVSRDQDQSGIEVALDTSSTEEMSTFNIQQGPPVVANESSLLDKGIPTEVDRCSVCNVATPGVQTWMEHVESSTHKRHVKESALKGLALNTDEIPLSKEGNLSVQPKRYIGDQADVEAYVDQLITDELNQMASKLLTKLIEWQNRTRQTDPVNAKKKRRYVCGMREASKAVKLGKVLAVIAAPNIQPLPLKEGVIYPISVLLEECKEKNVDFIFALSRRKMGKLLGQRKNASLFALLNVDGAESDFKLLQSMAEDLKIT